MILRAFLVVLLALCLAPLAQAQSDLPAPTYAPNGGSFSNPPVASLGAARSFVNTPAGGVSVRDGVSALLSGRAVAMQLARDLSKSQVASVAARCLLNPLCVGTAAAAAVAANLVADRCAIQGGAFVCDAGSDPASSTVPCWRDFSGRVAGCHASAESLARQVALIMDASESDSNNTFTIQTGATLQTVHPGDDPNIARVYIERVISFDSGGYYGTDSSRYIQVNVSGTMEQSACGGGAPVGADGRCPSGVYTPPTEADATGMVDSLPPGTVDGSSVVPASVGAGAPVSGTTPGTLTGPASIPGTTTTTTGATGTTTATTTNNITYQGNSYTYVTNITTVNPDGTTTTTEETPNEIAPPANPALGAIPTLYERAYPDGLAGVWETRRAQLGQTPIFSFVYSLVPQTGDGGCPSWSLPGGQLLGITVGGDLSVPCYVWSFIRLVLVCSALLLARALIFGG